MLLDVLKHLLGIVWIVQIALTLWNPLVRKEVEDTFPQSGSDDFLKNMQLFICLTAGVSSSELDLFKLICQSPFLQ